MKIQTIGFQRGPHSSITSKTSICIQWTFYFYDTSLSTTKTASEKNPLHFVMWEIFWSPQIQR